MKIRLPIVVCTLFLLILPIFVGIRSYAPSTNTLYAHSETITLSGGNIYYLHKLSSADGPATTLSQSASSTGRKEMGRWVYSLNGIVSISASTWTVTYRTKKSSSASSVIAHCDVSIYVMKSDNTIRATIATNVANSPSITSSSWQTLTGTYNFASYTVVGQTDYLLVKYYIEVTQKQSYKSVYLLVDDSTLPQADQTKIANVIFTYPNQAPVASFTYTPDYPLIYEDVTFNASASYDPDGSIVSYQWDFGDGNITTVPDPIITHVYTIAGSQVNYTVTLTVTDNGGSTDFTTQNVLVTNPTILYVSLPAGAYVGPDSDNWLSQCWLLNITGGSGTFTVRIRNTACGVMSFNTHLVIALNDAAYTYFNSLTVGTPPTAIPKTAFVSGTPTPYGYTLTWEEDVYPTWFSDVYVVGDICPNSYIDVEVSVTFSNPSDVRMHFDAYGSAKCPPPSRVKYVTHNPHEKDSTVLFCPPPIVRYYLTVGTAPSGVTTIPGEGWYDEGTVAVLTAPEEVPVSTGVRYLFSYWDVDDTSKVGNPIMVTMDANHTATAHYVLQYYLTVTSPYGTPGGEGWYDKDSTAYATVTPLTVLGTPGTRYIFIQWSGDASGTASPSNPIAMNGPKTAVADWKAQHYLTVTSPFGTPGGEGWYDSGTFAYATLDTDTIDHGNGTRRVFTQWSEDASGTDYALSDPILMSNPKCAIANWKTQYYLTASSPSNSPPYGAPTPTSGWFDAGTNITASVTSPWPGPPGTQYVCTGWIGTGSVPPSGTGTSVTFTVNEPSSITWTWKTQYYLTVSSDYDSPTPTSDWFDAGTEVVASVTSPWPGPSGTQYVCTGWVGTGNVPSSGTEPTVAFTINEPSNITWTWKTQYQVIFDQTGVGSDFTGTVVTINGVNYAVNDLPTAPNFWWDKDSNHTFSFASPLVVNGKQYVWQSTSGLSALQTDMLTITVSGNVIGNYIVQNHITFDQTGVGTDFAGVVVTIDGVNYTRAQLPISFPWNINSTHTFAFKSPLPVNSGKRYVWNSTTDLSSSQSGSIKVTTYGSIVGNYKTKYCLTVSSSHGTTGGEGWYYSGSTAHATVTPLIVPGTPGIQYIFTHWSGDATGNTSPSNPIIMNAPKTATANWKTQYVLDVSPPSPGSPNPTSGWFDAGVTASVTSPSSGPSGTQYVCTGWVGIGSVPPSGTGKTVTFTINEPSTITWQWKTQYYLTVQTNAPTTIPGGGWYDTSTRVSLTAPYVAGYEFVTWEKDGTPVSGNPIEVHMDGPHTAYAYYERIEGPVGGYSVSLDTPAGMSPLFGYTMILAMLGVAISLIRRKRK